MASFLNGLMGGLKSLGGGLSSKVGSLGLLGSLEDISPMGAIGGASSGLGALGSGIMNAIGAEGSDKVTPETSFTPSGPQSPQYEKPGFFTRINTPNDETGLSFVDKLSRFGASLQDIDDGGDRVAGFQKLADSRLAKTKAAQDKATMAAQIKALFPDDPRMQFVLMTAPEKGVGALADVYKSNNEAANVDGGATRVYGQSGRTFTAPKYGEADGYGYQVGPNGIDWGDERPQSYTEREAARHNREAEAIDRSQVDVSRGNLGVAQGNLDVARGHLGLAREKAAGGGAGASGDISKMSTADLINILRNGR